MEKNVSRRTDDYARQPVEETVKSLNTDAGGGLSSAEAAERLAEFGYNEISEKEEPLWHRIFRRFWAPIPWMIEAAAVLSALARKWDDFAIISVMLLVNAGLDFFQEHRALNALKALKQRMSAETIVLREGSFKKIPSRELVPGDIIKLLIGNIVPADVQLMKGDYLLIDQSALTGESLPVSKKTNDTAYAGTIVKQGEMLAVVANTGPRTNYHTVVALVAKASLEERSHFQKMVIRIGDFLIIITIILVVFIIIVALLRHEPFLEIARFALVLTVASIPVALPAVLSVTMAIGAMNLARRKAIVSRLTAIEELAGVDVFCSDKTGTLTQNEMQVAEPVVFAGHDERELFVTAALASREENRDPIELPIFAYADRHFPGGRDSGRQLSFTPFDPVRKRTEAKIELDGQLFTAMKGAAQVLLGMAELPGERSQGIRRQVDELASKGYRTLLVARKSGDQPPNLLGLIPLYDPPRKDSKSVIGDMEDHGIDVKMVTGDNTAIAREIGGMLGLQQRILPSSEFSGAAESSALTGKIESADIFAEVVPEDKYRIVDSLQQAGHIVGMTGDGVNDAPALKKADCGIAVSNATDAARAAASIILTAPGLGVINEAVKQARITFERMKSYSIYRIAETIRVILFMTASIVLFNFYPVTALMIILLALFNDIPILSIAYDRTRVQKRPVRWNMTELLSVSTALGVIGIIASFGWFYILMKLGFPKDIIQSLIFLKLVVAGHATIFLTRTEDWFWKPPYPSALLLHAGFWSAAIATLIVVYGVFVTPTGWKYALWTWGYALAWVVLNDAIKKGTYRLVRRREAAA